MDITPYMELFSSYARCFYSRIKEDQGNILLKEKHSLRVYENATVIGEAHGFSPRLLFLTRLAALFHDAGRFEQYRRFRTFKDDVSLDHARLGSAVLKKERVLDGLSPGDRRIVLVAVLLHNKKALPASLRPEYNECVSAVRDADKLDIIPVVIEHLRVEKKDRTITLGLRDEPDKYTPMVLDQVRSGGLVNYGDMVYINDFKLLLVSWVYGLNFAYSYALLEKKHYLHTLVGLLPDIPDLNSLKEKVLRFVHARGGLENVV